MLTKKEREIITVLQSQNYRVRQLAKILGRSASTISRELNRKETIYF